jgi:superfamily II DNA or RNA helicase
MRTATLRHCEAGFTLTGLSSDLLEHLPDAWQDGPLTVAPVSKRNVDTLRSWFDADLVDCDPVALLGQEHPRETPAAVTLRPGWRLEVASRSTSLLDRLQQLYGYWRDTRTGEQKVSPNAWSQLLDLRDEGLLDDPHGLLVPYRVTIGVDFVAGGFRIEGDARAAEAFTRKFPHTDVVPHWRSKGHDVGFAPGLAEEIYHGERARHGPGFQPAGFAGELYPYQAASVAVALERTGFAVLHEPGLGKTIIGIAWAMELLERRQVPRAVVVCPSSVRSQWADEIRRFAGHDDVVVVKGDAKSRTGAYQQARTARWLVLHYDVLHRDGADIEPLVKGAALIADEAHRIKNPKSRRSQHLRILARKARRRLALTGTPVENHPAEWYTLLNGFVQPGSLGDPKRFFDRYQNFNGFGYEGAKNLDELHRRSSIWFDRATKTQVTPHLPVLRSQLVRLDSDDETYLEALSLAHKLASDEIRNSSVAARWGNDAADTADMTAVTMLRMLCSSPRLVEGSSAPSAQVLRDAGLICDSDGPKVEELLLRAAEWQFAGQRAVVFTAFRQMAELVIDRLTAAGVRCVSYTGADSHDAREASVAAFVADPTDTDPGPTVLVATDAAAEGLNLGRNCSLLVNLDVPWTPGRAEQRANRIHRVDSTHTSYLVVTLTVRGSIEDGLVLRLGAKAGMADALLAEDHARRLVAAPNRDDGTDTTRPAASATGGQQTLNL